MGFLIFGSVLSLLGILILFGEILSHVSCTQRIPARVVRTVKDTGSYWKGTFRYYPVFSYTVNGKEYTAKDSSSPTRNKNKYTVGKEAVIKCNPQKPEEFRTGARISTYVVSTGLLATGITLIVCFFL